MPNVNFPFNLTINQGDDREVIFIFTEDDDTTPIDIALWDFFYTAKSSSADLDAAAIISLEPADFIKSASGGVVLDTITFVIPASATGAAAVGTYVQDLQRTIAAASVLTLGIGQLIIEAQVTQRTS